MSSKRATSARRHREQSGARAASSPGDRCLFLLTRPAPTTAASTRSACASCLPPAASPPRWTTRPTPPGQQAASRGSGEGRRGHGGTRWRHPHWCGRHGRYDRTRDRTGPRAVRSSPSCRPTSNLISSSAPDRVPTQATPCPETRLQAGAFNCSKHSDTSATRVRTPSSSDKTCRRSRYGGPARRADAHNAVSDSVRALRGQEQRRSKTLHSDADRGLPSGHSDCWGPGRNRDREGRGG